MLPALDEINRAREHRPVRRTSHHHHHASGSKQDGGRVHEWRNQVQAGTPAQRALRELEREVQQQRRQQRHRDRVTPVENPVEAIERADERERECAEERDAEPEEMQRRLIVGTTQPHRRAHQQRKEAHGREDEVHRAAARRGRELDVERLAHAEADQRV